MRARQFWRQHVRSWPRAVATQRRRASNQTNQLPRSIPHQPTELYPHESPRHHEEHPKNTATTPNQQLQLFCGAERGGE